MSINSIVLAYTAGFLDAEGCFKYIKGGKNSGGCIGISVTNTYRPALERLANAFGGNIRLLLESTEVTKRTYSWEICSKKAADVCLQILPYLKEKRPQAQLLLDFQATVGNSRRLSKEVKECRMKIAEELKKLKHIEYR